MSSQASRLSLWVFRGALLVAFVAGSLPSVSAADFGDLWDKYGGKSRSSTAPNRPVEMPATSETPTVKADGKSNQKVFLDRGASGRFYVDGEINGRTIRFVVDTGASKVALTREDAERLGVTISRLRPLGPANTAGGVTKAYRLRLSSLKIGNIVVRDIQAAVVPAATGTSLLGMTFLSRLESYGERDGKMYLEGAS